LIDEPAFVGFVARTQTAETCGGSGGIFPGGKVAELVLRDAFATRWASDGPLRRPPELGAFDIGIH
jgi:hypothetical protein